MVGIKNKNFLLECGKYVENNFDVWEMWIIYFPQDVCKFVENKNCDWQKIAVFPSMQGVFACGYIVGSSWKEAKTR
jgi:hypothetical protein